MQPRWINRRALLTLVLAVWPALTPILAAAEPDAAALAEQVGALFEKQNSPDVPGCAVGIVQRGKVIYSKGFGTANLEDHAPNTLQTVFETASFSKTMTSLCLALLLDEGKIGPEDDLRKFIPEMQPQDPPIRIRDMVRCRSGLWDQVSVPILIGWPNAPQQVPHTKADFFTLITGQKMLPFAPGSQFRYSSGDYFLLGIVVERVSGKSLPDFARERIFQPLGMVRTHFEEDPGRIVEERAIGHYKQGKEWRLWRPTAYWVGGGGLKTCVEDLTRWDLDFEKTKLPRGKYVDGFLRDGMLLDNRSCLDVDAHRAQAEPAAKPGDPLGEYRGLKRRQYTGGAWGFTTAVTQFPSEQLTVVCLSNSDEVSAWGTTRKIADLLLADRLGPVALPAGAPASDLPTVDVPEVELRKLVGAYRLTTTGAIWQISFQNGSLQLTDHLISTFKLRPLGENRFDPEGPFYATTQLVFSIPTADGPPTMTSRWEEEGYHSSLKFEPVTLVKPAPEELQAYAGKFVSDELAATYRFEVHDGQLRFRINSRRWEELDPTVRDEFIPHLREPTEGRITRFIRNAEGKVEGLTVDYFRVQGVRFTKR